MKIATIAGQRSGLPAAGLLVAVLLASCGQPVPAGSGHAVAATTGAPSPREGAAMAYDPATQSVVLFGGDSGGAALGNTYSWDGSGWSELRPSVSPPPRTGALLAYDPQTRSLVLTGGHTAASSAGPMMTDTWTWDGSTWDPQPHGALPASGSTPWGDRLAADEATGQLILVTGLGSSSCTGIATWQWRGGSWARLDPESSLGAAGSALLGYDAQQGLLLYGAGDCRAPEGAGVAPAYVWSWDGSAWSLDGSIATGGAVQAPKMLIASAVAQAPGGGVLVPYAGTDILRPSGFTQATAVPGNLGALAPPNQGFRTGESVAYDAARNEVLLFGGQSLFGDGITYLGDTWTWDGGWHLASPGTAVTPPPTPVPTPTPAPSPCANPTPQAGNGGQLQNLHMFSTSDGWAQRVSDAAVLRTTDGGAQWIVASPSLSGDQQMVAASFLDASTAEVLTGTLYNCYPAPGVTSADLTAWSTSDGGTSWSQEGTFQVPGVRGGAFLGGALDFVNADDGWLSVNQGYAAGSSGMGLYRTVDGGVHWSEVAQTCPGCTTPASIPFGGDKGNAAFIDPTTGWIGSSTAGTGTLFWVTNDGGTDWSAQSLPGSSSLFQPRTDAPQFWSEQGGWVLVSGWLPVDTPDNPQTSALYMTTDAGGSWRQIATPGQGQLASAADFIDQDQGWVLTTPPTPPAPASPAPSTGPPVPSTTLWVTTNGGRSWSLVSSRTGEVQITSIDFVTTQVGWAATVDDNSSASGLLRTSDGGRTWTVMDPAISG